MQKNTENKNFPTLDEAVKVFKEWIGQPYEKDNHFLFLKWKRVENDNSPDMDILGISDPDGKKKEGIYEVLVNEDLGTEYDNWDTVIGVVLEWLGEPDTKDTIVTAAKWSNKSEDKDFHSFDLRIKTDEDGFVNYNTTSYDMDDKK